MPGGDVLVDLIDQPGQPSWGAGEPTACAIPAKAASYRTKGATISASVSVTINPVALLICDIARNASAQATDPTAIITRAPWRSINRPA